VQKKLQEATNTVDSASQRTRAIGRKLVTVEDMPSTGLTESRLGLNADEQHDDDDPAHPAD
jgi:DNA anti-recombination protein RmuC